MLSSEQLQVPRIGRENEATPESHRGRDDESVDGELAATVDAGEQVPCDPRGSSSCRHHPHEASTEKLVDRLVASTASIQLDEDCRRDSHRRPTKLGTA